MSIPASRNFNLSIDGKQTTTLVPLADMFGYATSLRSFTQGRGIYTMQFFGYSEVPKQLFNELVERLQRTIDDFNKEIANLTEEVKGNSEKRAEIIHTLMEGQDMSQSSSPANDTTESNLDSEIMSEWEKRLEGLK